MPRTSRRSPISKRTGTPALRAGAAQLAAQVADRAAIARAAEHGGAQRGPRDWVPAGMARRRGAPRSGDVLIDEIAGSVTVARSLPGPMSAARRVAHYRNAQPVRATLTPAQARRVAHRAAAPGWLVRRRDAEHADCQRCHCDRVIAAARGRVRRCPDCARITEPLTADEIAADKVAAGEALTVAELAERSGLRLTRWQRRLLAGAFR